MTKDERVAIGAKAFHAVKIAADRIPAGAGAAEDLGGEAFPRVVVFDADGKVVGALEGNITPSRLFDLMGRAAGAKLARFVKEYQKVLLAIDKVENAKEVLKLKKERLGDRAERDRSIPAKERELEAATTKIAEQEQKLLEKLTA